MRSRFVILHHTGYGVEHWDLMLQRGDVLLTWQLERDPLAVPAMPIRARRIGDHRITYLEFEGPVSGGRGVVRRVEGGELDWIDVMDTALSFRLWGHHLGSPFILKAESSGEDWLFSRAEIVDG